MGAILLLEDGRSFSGEAFGARGTRVGEVVFNTSMTGYQEILTDPSYREQIVAMSTAQVGNTGVNPEDMESDRVQVAGFVVRENSRLASNHRATDGLDRWLRAAGIPGLQGIDTRELVRHVRSRGAMRAVLSTDGTPGPELWARLEAWPGMVGRALAAEVTTPRPYLFADPEHPVLRVNVLDAGVKRSILRLLAAAGARVRVLPFGTPAERLAEDADALLVSNGPGDPAAYPAAVEALRGLAGRLPLLGICLGHQLLARALGAETFKLPFGHRGGNHPVRDEETGRVLITAQNHGFCVDPKGLRRAGARVTHVNLYDGTLEGFVHEDLRVMAVQFHPEAGPGPHDAHGLLVDRFLRFAGADLPDR